MLDDIGEPQSFEEFERETKAIVEPFRSVFGARWAHEARSSKPRRDWLLKDLILARTFGVVFGPPGCGKSFLVSDMCLSMAAGVIHDDGTRPTWFGYKGRPFGVVYVVAEGGDDFEIRLHAWMDRNEIPDDLVLPFVYLPTSIDLRSSDADAKRLIKEIKGVSEEMQVRCGVSTELVVIDTVARALTGGNENASEVMSAFVGNCGLVQEECGVAVLGVHHGTKDGGSGPRGHGGLHGAADFEFEVTGATADDPNVWSVRKLKAGRGGGTHRFRLRQVEVGKDDDGDAITSCVVVPKMQGGAGEKEKPKGFKANRGERELLLVLADVITQKGVMPPHDVKVQSRVSLVANMRDVGAAFRSRYAATEMGSDEEVSQKLRARWKRAMQSLMSCHVIGSEKPWMWFTGKEVRDFRIRGVQTIEAAPTHVEAIPPPPDDDFSANVDLSNI